MPKKYLKGKYNIKQPEQRGRVEAEPSLYNSFWKQHTMDQILAMTDQELDDAISRFVDNYVEAAKSRNRNWNFPDSLVMNIARKASKKSKYKAEPFNKSFGTVDNGNPFIV
jgi:exonuclease I